MMATLMWNAKAPCCTSFEAFRLEITKLFDRSARGSSWQSGLSQGITDFAICFCTLAASCEGNEPALRARFMEGLNATTADELALDLPQKLEDLINLSLRVEGRLAQRHQRRLLTGPWHASLNLPTEATPSWILEQCNLECNFIDGNTARKWFIPAIPLPKPIIAWTLADRPLTTITHTTPHVSLLLSGNHSEGIELYILESPNTTITLGHPWLLQHNPQVDWSNNSVLAWSLSCHESCLGPAPCPVYVSSVLQVDLADLTRVPEEYRDLRSVFSKSRATSLN